MSHFIIFTCLLLHLPSIDERETERQRRGKGRGREREREGKRFLVVVLLSIGLFQKSSPEQVFVGGRDKHQLASCIHRKSVIYHHRHPLPKVPELEGESPHW